MFLLRRTARGKRAEEERAEPDELLRLDRIEELLEQGHFSRAYEEAEKARADGRDKERCLLVLAGAAYGMRKWELSVRHYEELVGAFPSNQQARDGLHAALSRQAEERTGNYDFAKLYEAARRGDTDVDVADYVGPIEVVDIPGKGKGIVATRDVKKGTLLLVSKAFIIAPSSLSDSTLVPAIKEKIARQPERIADVAGLYYGCERNAATPQETDWQSVTKPTRLDLICWYNTFSYEGGFIDEQRGIWILPSFFNHSCLANADRMFYGDIMTAFAMMDVKQGDELTFSYVPFMDSYEQRKSNLMMYDVVCDCRLCELDREDPRCRERERLSKGIIRLLIEKPQSAQKAISILKRVVDQNRESYANRSDDLKIHLYFPLKTLAGAYQRMGEHAEAVTHLLESTKCIPECAMPVLGVWAYAQIAVCCDRMRRPRTARRYARLAADLHRVGIGHDDELFKKTHTNIAHLL